LSDSTPLRIKRPTATMFDTPAVNATPINPFSPEQIETLKNNNNIQKLLEKAEKMYHFKYNTKPTRKMDIIKDMENASNGFLQEDGNLYFVNQPQKKDNNINEFFTPKSKKQSGKGINDSSTHKEFGNHRINIPKLKGNILHLSFPCGSPVRKIKPRYISDNFKEFLEYF
jgi:hypothetical protein